MYSQDSSDIMFPESGSRLLSESPPLPSSSSHTGPGGDDLSISELSLSDRTAIFEKPFTLLAPSEQRPSTPTRESTQEVNPTEEEQDDDGSDDDEHVEQARRHAAKLREEKLQSDIFILRKLNASFALFNDALQDTGSANMRVAAQLEQTDALLNKYIGILSKSEEFARLIFDEQWQGAEEDYEILEREMMEERERERREAEERALAAQREQERQRREEQERLEQEERERIERERKERATSRGSVRGVRGTRASMRGVRGTVPTATSRVRSGSANTGQTGSSGIPSRLPTATAGGRPSTTGPASRGTRRT